MRIYFTKLDTVDCDIMESISNDFHSLINQYSEYDEPDSTYLPIFYMDIDENKGYLNTCLHQLEKNVDYFPYDAVIKNHSRVKPIGSDKEYDDSSDEFDEIYGTCDFIIAEETYKEGKLVKTEWVDY